MAQDKYEIITEDSRHYIQHRLLKCWFRYCYKYREAAILVKENLEAGSQDADMRTNHVWNRAYCLYSTIQHVEPRRPIQAESVGQR